MAFVTGDVIANPDEELPYSVVFKRGETVVVEWLVGSVAEGEAQIIEYLQSLVEIEEDNDGKAA